MADERQKIAFQEYYFVEDMIDRFDGRSVNIKSWSVTISAGAIGAAILNENEIIFLLASASSLVFWYIEFMWKYCQHILIRRAKEIELFINGSCDDYSGPRIAAKFAADLKWRVELRHFRKIFFYRNVSVPHGVIFLVGILLYFISMK